MFVCLFVCLYLYLFGFSLFLFFGFGSVHCRFYNRVFYNTAVQNALLCRPQDGFLSKLRGSTMFVCLYVCVCMFFVFVCFIFWFELVQCRFYTLLCRGPKMVSSPNCLYVCFWFVCIFYLFWFNSLQILRWSVLVQNTLLSRPQDGFLSKLRGSRTAQQAFCVLRPPRRQLAPKLPLSL